MAGRFFVGLSLGFSLVFGHNAFGQNVPPYGAPASMQLCVGNCENLTWTDGHYDGRRSGDDTVMTTYRIVRWQADGFELSGTLLRASGGGMSVTGRFTGKLSAAGGSITDGKAVWTMKLPSGAETPMSNTPFNLTWNLASPVAAPVKPSVAPAAVASPPETQAPLWVEPKTPPPNGLPRMLFVREKGGPGGGSFATLIWNGTNYDGYWLTGYPSIGLTGKVTVVSLVDGDLTLGRVDTAPYQITGTYKGKWDHDHVVGGKLEESFQGKTEIVEFTAETLNEISATESDKLLIRRGMVDAMPGLRAMRVHGTVKLDFTICPVSDGSVAMVLAVRQLSKPNPNPRIDDAAKQSVGGSGYHPYLVDGKPTPVHTTIDLTVP